MVEIIAGFKGTGGIAGIDRFIVLRFARPWLLEQKLPNGRNLDTEVS
jgi:hypothetical protein